MEKLKQAFPLAHPAVLEAIEGLQLEALIYFWGRVAPEVDNPDDCSPELKDTLNAVCFAIDVIGEAMMSPEQAEASRQREIAVLQLN